MNYIKLKNFAIHLLTNKKGFHFDIFMAGFSINFKMEKIF